MPAMRGDALRVAILGNGAKAEVRDEIGRLRETIREIDGLRIVAVDLDPDTDLSGLGESAEVALVLGGDGTVLHAARRMKDSPTPVLGINLGRLGFLAELSPCFLGERLADLAERRFTIENLMTLSCSVRLADGSTAAYRGLNDVVLRSAPPFSLIEIGLRIDGESVINYRVDGLIVATPVGSTAHSLSAGGPIVPHDAHVFVVTPICAHTLTQRPLLDGAHKRYELTTHGDPPHPVMLVVDGQIQVPLSSEAHVVVRRGEHPFPMVRLPNHSFYRTLRDKLGWGTNPAPDRGSGHLP